MTPRVLRPGAFFMVGGDVLVVVARDDEHPVSDEPHRVLDANELDLGGVGERGVERRLAGLEHPGLDVP